MGQQRAFSYANVSELSIQARLVMRNLESCGIMAQTPLETEPMTGHAVYP